MCPPLVFEQVQDFGCTMLHRMQQARPVPRDYNETTVPDSTFVSMAANSQATTHTTIATTDGNLTMKLLKMKKDKERQMAAKRDAALEAMNELAEKRAEEAEAKRQDVAIRKAEQAARRRRAVKEKKAEEIAASNTSKESCIATREGSKSN